MSSGTDSSQARMTTDMQKIHHLSQEVIAKIAAGEVIERPSYAVKELIENAIDAGTTEITILIEQAGIKKIQITDNGEGMNKEDLQECWKPHTTSKLTGNDTLLGIKSFGFRGEALASLAAISTFTIRSRPQDQLTGHQVEITYGKMMRNIPVGMPQGTTVIAENLFSQVPARKKFLKSTQTEFRHIVDVVNHFSLAYPSIRFLLKHNNRVIIDFPQNTTFEERIQSIIGQHAFSFFLPIKNNDSHLVLSGFIAKPQLNAATQSRQLLFVNKRKVTDRLISLAVKEAYGTMLESNVYPLFVLFLEFPYEMVDVNVHPRKEQVTFFNNQLIFQTIKETVSEVLQENNITFQNLSWKRTGYGTTHSFAGKLLKQTVLDKGIFTVKNDSHFIQINNLYIFNQTLQGLILTDQHAAHERILFEKLKREFIKQKNKKKSIQLKEPAALYLSQSEQLLLEEHKKLFKNLGFVITSFVRKPITVKKHSLNASPVTVNATRVVTHVPFLLQDRNPEELIKQLLENVEQDLPLKEIDTVSEEMIAFLACRAAVKAGDSLNEEQMKKIVQDLNKTENNTTCPHGRPTRIILTMNEINGLFKR